MKIIIAIAFLFFSCSSPRQVILRINRGDCVRVDKIPKDVELIILDCNAAKDTILTVKNVAVYDYPKHGLKLNTADIETLYIGTIISKYPFPSIEDYLKKYRSERDTSLSKQDYGTTNVIIGGRTRFNKYR